MDCLAALLILMHCLMLAVFAKTRNDTAALAPCARRGRYCPFKCERVAGMIAWTRHLIITNS